MLISDSPWLTRLLYSVIERYIRSKFVPFTSPLSIWQPYIGYLREMIQYLARKAEWYRSSEIVLIKNVITHTYRVCDGPVWCYLEGRRYDGGASPETPSLTD